MIYLHENPVRAGIVRFEQDYLYSSGIDYYGNGKGLIDIIFYELRSPKTPLHWKIETLR